MDSTLYPSVTQISALNRALRRATPVIALLAASGLSACETMKEGLCMGLIPALTCMAIEAASHDSNKNTGQSSSGVSVQTPRQREAHIAELKSRAKKNDSEAIIELAEITGNIKPVRPLAQSGNLPAAYFLYEQLWKKEETSKVAWLWLCKAANGRYPRAQLKIAYWYEEATWNIEPSEIRIRLRDVGIQPNDKTAYMWFEVAAASGATPAQSPYKSWGAHVLTTTEIYQAEQMAHDWKPGDCPSAEHRLPPPGET